MQSLHRYIVEKGNGSIDTRFLDNLAFTLNERRTILPWRATVVAGTMEDLMSSLSRQVRAKSAIKRPKLGFVFTGQGAQWPGMGKELLQAYPVFQDSVMNIDRYLDEIDAGFRVQG
jgi:acyl transferase domain-containing protein